MVVFLQINPYLFKIQLKEIIERERLWFDFDVTQIRIYLKIEHLTKTNKLEETIYLYEEGSNR